MNYIERDKVKGISNSFPSKYHFHLKEFKFCENKNYEEKIFRQLAESGLERYTQISSPSYLSFSKREWLSRQL